MLDKSIFHAYDIRGKYPDQINEAVVAEICGRIPEFLKNPKTIIVGHDVRLSSPALYEAAIKELANADSCFRRNDKNTKSYKLTAKSFEIVPVGLVTTPMFYFLVNDLKASGGIMITASHNPKEFNGLKIVKEKAMPINTNDLYRIICEARNPNVGIRNNIK